MRVTSASKQRVFFLSTYHTYSVADGLGWQVACELSTHHATVTMSTHDFTPDNPSLIGLPTWGDCGSKDKAQQEGILEQWYGILIWCKK